MTAFSVKLGDLYAKRSPSVNPSRYPDEEFDLLSVPAHDRKMPDRVAGHEIGSSKISVSPGDVLLCRIVPHIRRAWVVPESGERRQIASGEWMVFRDERANPEYLRHLVLSNSFHSQFMSTVAGVGGSLLRARPAQAASIEVPLPPLPEQRRIAAILDQADELRAKRHRALILLDELADSIFIEMFGDPNRTSQDDRRLRLGDITDIASGSTPDRSRNDYYGGGIPWIKTAEVSGRKILETSETVSETGRRAARLRIFPVDSIAVAMYGQGKTRGQSALIGLPATTNQACAVILPSNKFKPVFMAHQLRMMYPTLRLKGRGGSQANLNLSLVQDTLVLVPSENKQDEFEARMSSLEDLRILLMRSSEFIDELFNSLQHRAFRGEC